jgi:hypothetical protein
LPAQVKVTIASLPYSNAKRVGHFTLGETQSPKRNHVTIVLCRIDKTFASCAGFAALRGGGGCSAVLVVIIELA